MSAAITEYSWFPPTMTLMGVVVVGILTFIASKRTQESQRISVLWSRIDRLENRVQKQDYRNRKMTEYAWTLRQHIYEGHPPPPPPWPVFNDDDEEG